MGVSKVSVLYIYIDNVFVNKIVSMILNLNI